VIEMTPDRRLVGELPMAAAPWAARPCLSLVRLGFDTFPADADLEVDFEYRVRCLAKKDPAARRFALERLAEFRFWAAAAIPKLKAHGEDPDPGVREAMRKALTALGAETIPQLIAETKDEDPDRRYRAFGRLGGYRDGPGVLDRLLEGLKDENSKVRWIVARALGIRNYDPQSRFYHEQLPGGFRVGTERIVRALVDSAKDPDGKVRGACVESLGLMGATSKSSVPALIDVMKNDKEPLVRYQAAIALGRIGQDSPEATSTLLAALKDSRDLAIRRGAIEGVCYLRP
jgi:HEAT repeat protein